MQFQIFIENIKISLEAIRSHILRTILTVLIIAWVLRAFGLGWQSDSPAGNTPLDTLKHRFARGEIDRAENEERKKLLSGA